MIISVDSGKSLNKIQCPFMIINNNSEQTMNYREHDWMREHPQSKRIYKKKKPLTANIVFLLSP